MVFFLIRLKKTFRVHPEIMLRSKNQVTELREESSASFRVARSFAGTVCANGYRERGIMKRASRTDTGLDREEERYRSIIRLQPGRISVIRLERG